MKKNFNHTICFTLFVIIIQANFLNAQEKTHPNFIFVLADDMGWSDLGADGSHIETPNLDRMAEQGVKFTNFYAMAPMCSPTRASFLTGRYPHTVGVPVLCNPNIRGNLPMHHLDLEALTIPEQLKQCGYKTMLAGKWHLGYGTEYWPRKHGFDRFWGSLIGTPKYWNPEETYDNETPIKVDGYFTNRITEKSLEFIEENKDDPFFLYVAYNAPHYPLEAPQEIIDKYKKVFDYEQFAIYAAMVECMDRGIGQIFDKLTELGLDENTFIFFTSDNGPSAENKGNSQYYGLRGAQMSAGPLREYKFSTFEGGIRVPAIAWWPGQIKSSVKTDQEATIMDIFPTYLEILNAEPNSELHGESLLPILKGIEREQKKSYHWETAFMWGVRKGTWKLVGRYWENEPYLFDLSKDIGEQSDLKNKFPEVKNELIDLHRQWEIKNYPDPYPRWTKGRSKYHFPLE